jgi:hypothetical protein
MVTARRWTWLLGLLPVLLLVVPAGALEVEVHWNVVQEPVVVTEAATNITSDGAILHGRLTDLGGADTVTVSFEWGTTPAMGEETPSQILNESGIFSASISGLDAGTDYYFRARAIGNGTALGDTLTFRTTVGPVTDETFPQFWIYIIIAAAVLLASYVLLRRRHLGAPEEDRLIEKAFVINNKGQLLKELTFGTDGVELGYRDLLKLLVGKGLIKVETVKSGKHYVHFLHKDGIHMACVSANRSREKVLERASRLFEDLKDEL